MTSLAGNAALFFERASGCGSDTLSPCQGSLPARQFRQRTIIKARSVEIAFGAVQDLFGDKLANRVGTVGQAERRKKSFVSEDQLARLLRCEGCASDESCDWHCDKLQAVTGGSKPAIPIAAIPAASDGIIEAPSSSFEKGCLRSKTDFSTGKDQYRPRRAASMAIRINVLPARRAGRAAAGAAPGGRPVPLHRLTRLGNRKSPAWTGGPRQPVHAPARDRLFFQSVVTAWMYE